VLPRSIEFPVATPRRQVRPAAVGEPDVICLNDDAGKNEKAHNEGCFLHHGRGCRRRSRPCALPVGFNGSHTSKLGSYFDRDHFGNAVAYPMPALPHLAGCEGTSDHKGQPNYR
jgi:hypothetical protein